MNRFSWWLFLGGFEVVSVDGFRGTVGFQTGNGVDLVGGEVGKFSCSGWWMGWAENDEGFVGFPDVEDQITRLDIDEVRH